MYFVKASSMFYRFYPLAMSGKYYLIKTSGSDDLGKNRGAKYNSENLPPPIYSQVEDPLNSEEFDYNYGTLDLSQFDEKNRKLKAILKTLPKNRRQKFLKKLSKTNS